MQQAGNTERYVDYKARRGSSDNPKYHVGMDALFGDFVNHDVVQDSTSEKDQAGEWTVVNYKTRGPKERNFGMNDFGVDASAGDEMLRAAGAGSVPAPATQEETERPPQPRRDFCAVEGDGV